jgi:hypothetical protein
MSFLLTRVRAPEVLHGGAAPLRQAVKVPRTPGVFSFA